MSEIKGKILITELNTGSKSDGAVAKLHTADGKAYTLYRENSLPQDDPFFGPLNEQDVIVNGNIEEENSHICVDSIILADGSRLLPPAPVQSANIVFFNEAEPASSVTKSVKRLPRKLKKLLKKNKNND